MADIEAIMKSYPIFLALFLVYPLTANAKTPVKDKKTEILIQNLEKKIVLETKNQDLFIELGFAYSKMKMINKSRAAFEKAVSINPKKPIAYYMLGLIYEKQELKNKAIESWRNCLKYAKEKNLRETAMKHIHFLEAE